MSGRIDSGRVLARGFFDGVHLGHAALLKRTGERALELGLESAVITFDTHPDKLIRGEALPLICSAATRASLIREGFGIGKIVFFPFNQETMRMSWLDFIRMMRVEMEAAHFVVGYDFRFGWRGEGSAEKLSAYCAENALGCDVVPRIALNGVTVSSSLIRRFLQEGKVREAGRFLGHPHVLEGEVRHGYRLGSRLGVPTINMFIPEGVLTPRRGVYAAKVHVPGGSCIAVTNVGVRPTVGGGDTVSVESYILDYEGDLYGETLRLEFHEFLRPEEKFKDVEQLKLQIGQDIEATRAYFADNPSRSERFSVGETFHE